MGIADDTQPSRETERIPDRMISIAEIRALFRLGRTAAYELTHRPDFPEPVVISTRCHRWWASEVIAFADAIRSQNPRPRRHGNGVRPSQPQIATPSTPGCRIAGKVRVARPRKATS